MKYWKLPVNANSVSLSLSLAHSLCHSHSLSYCGRFWWWRHDLQYRFEGSDQQTDWAGSPAHGRTDAAAYWQRKTWFLCFSCQLHLILLLYSVAVVLQCVHTLDSSKPLHSVGKGHTHFVCVCVCAWRRGGGQWYGCQCLRFLTCTLMSLYSCTHGLCKHCKRVCAESWLREKNPSLDKGFIILYILYEKSFEMCICLWPEFDCPEVIDIYISCVVDRTLKSED